jgi:hypothetical protein
VQSKPNATNLASGTNIIGNATTNPNDVPCPSSTPYFNGTDCISCQSPSPLFNLNTLKCSSCPSGTSYDINTNSCVQLKPNATNLASGTNILGNLTSNPNDIPCPASTPYFNGTSCISCQSPNPLFDVKTQKCTSCPNGTNYDSTLSACLTPVAASPNATNVAAATNYTGPKPVSAPYDVPCPSSTPYFDGTICISCKGTTPIFNTSSSACTACPDGTKFNNATHKCDPLPNVTNIATGAPYVGPNPVTSANDVPCPGATPYFNGTGCINCTDPNIIFNTSSSTCTKCPTGTTFDNSVHNCIRQPNITNPVANNNTIGFFPSPTQYDVPCPDITPIFSNGSCTTINCTTSAPYLNITSLKCVPCPANTTYNNISHLC